MKLHNSDLSWSGTWSATEDSGRMMYRSRGRNKGGPKSGAAKGSTPAGTPATTTTADTVAVDKAAAPSEEGKAPAPPTGGGGKSGVADPATVPYVTETTLIPTVPPGYVLTSTKRLVLAGKTRTMALYDTALRVTVWAFDCKSYFSYSDPSTTPADLLTTEREYQDWYKLARDIIIRDPANDNLIEPCLSNKDLLRYYLNCYTRVVANCEALLNMSRLPIQNTGMSRMNVYLPRIMSRVTRLWKNLSTLLATPVVKAHALRCGTIVWAPGVLAPHLRLWKGNYELPSSSGGPREIDQFISGAAAITAYDLFTAMTEGDHPTTQIEKFLEWLEAGYRWLKEGTEAIQDDWALMKDMMEWAAIHKTTVGSFTTGLPEIAKLPGLTVDASILTDLLARAQFLKVDIDAGTDQWYMYPVVGNLQLQQRVPIMGLGTPTIYDDVSMGAPKFGQLAEEDDLTKCDVDSAMWCDGTEHMVGSDFRAQTEDIRAHFGLADQEIVILKNGTEDTAVDNVLVEGAELAQVFSTRSLASQHVMAAALGMELTSIHLNAISHYWEECDVAYIRYPNPVDFGMDTAQMIANGLKVSDLFEGACTIIGQG